ncbi:hypothetical protein [Pseudonocardia sp. D17]|uniref:hypothetical protein n=1 Tax=Pseudonocardia sp. D17 TaxID=882661 RepID=UPI002B3B8BD4|nr:hypothetical protein PSD17_56370 [Pseudonocardia sp. D17]
MADDLDDPHAEDDGPWPRLEPVTSARLGIDVYSDPRVPRGQVWAMPVGGWPPEVLDIRPGARIAFRGPDGSTWTATVTDATPDGRGGWEITCTTVEDWEPPPLFWGDGS